MRLIVRPPGDAFAAPGRSPRPERAGPGARAAARRS